MIFRHVRLRNYKLMTKLMITYLLLTVIPISVLGYVAYSQYTNSVEEQVGEYIPKLLEQANGNIDHHLDEMKRLPDSLYNSPQVIEILRKDSYQSKSNLLRDEFLVNSFLSRTYINGGNSDILGVFLLSKNRLYKSTKVTYSGLGLESSFLPYGQDLDLEGKEEVLLPYETNLKFKGNPPFILLMKQLRDFENQENLGTMLIAVELTFFEKALSNLKEEGQSSIWMTDSAGRIFFHTDPEFIGKFDDKYSEYPRINGSFRTTGLADNDLISTADFQGNDWKIFHSIPLSDLTQEADAVRNGTIIVFILVVLLSIGISILLAWNVSNPLNKLAKLMKQVEKGNFNVDLLIDSRDEVGTLAKSFNSMMQEINQLIKKNYQIELRQKDAELYALQSQINPHFMYNTLETIGYAVEEEETEVVVKMVTLLGRMLRYSLNNKDRVVPISFEVLHTNNYLTIQKFRFEDRIHFEIYEEIDTNRYYTPKFILQPIIENAIKYGLEEYQTCVIQIFIRKTANNELMIKVKDNGPGIDETVLSKLNGLLGKDPMAGRNSGFGLRNVHARIAMIFGDPYGLEIKSKIHEGTEVIIKIPMLTGEQAANISGGVESA
ncbi:sensor histidine kinase [Mesobacillus foraminis]|uniref:Two-component system sensor histidine kinase YesM n=1 Tax=Mesobacillus foraminis TaxID=279826 RepID=A0A4R2BFX1_9BACI|nr:sensor histidine kinase [Mesobacillus foraminis]TCN25403.1 two-component system sensor histidine kinase YesM [Mesobacillus foraminis]